MSKVLKYILLLNLSLASASLIGSAWVSRSVGSQAYVAGAWATVVVGLAGSIALLLTYWHSRNSSPAGDRASQSPASVSGILLAMLVRMGLPLLVVAFMMQTKNPLMQSGFFGLLTINYLVALPIETLLSLQFINHSKPIASSGLNGSNS